MNLTMYDLENLQKSCSYVVDLVKELKQIYNPENSQRKLFVSRNDYNESLMIKNEKPQDFYYFRLFNLFRKSLPSFLFIDAVIFPVFESIKLFLCKCTSS